MIAPIGRSGGLNLSFPAGGGSRLKNRYTVQLYIKQNENEKGKNYEENY